MRRLLLGLLPDRVLQRDAQPRTQTLRVGAACQRVGSAGLRSRAEVLLLNLVQIPFLRLRQPRHVEVREERRGQHPSEQALRASGAAARHPDLDEVPRDESLIGAWREAAIVEVPQDHGFAHRRLRDGVGYLRISGHQRREQERRVLDGERAARPQETQEDFVPLREQAQHLLLEEPRRGLGMGAKDGLQQIAESHENQIRGRTDRSRAARIVVLVWHLELRLPFALPATIRFRFDASLKPIGSPLGCGRRLRRQKVFSTFALSNGVMGGMAVAVGAEHVCPLLGVFFIARSAQREPQRVFRCVRRPRRAALAQPCRAAAFRIPLGARVDAQITQGRIQEVEQALTQVCAQKEESLVCTLLLRVRSLEWASHQPPEHRHRPERDGVVLLSVVQQVGEGVPNAFDLNRHPVALVACADAIDRLQQCTDEILLPLRQRLGWPSSDPWARQACQDLADGLQRALH
eukprot:scaffold8259_cov248-Pinguiococcus_pyrenoidosus.AAC.1